ncbi:unnamed protein product [Gordionus sp. m RMFG-2023]
MFMNSDCEAYAKHNSYQFHIYTYLLSRIIPSIKECDNVLDVGCGDGNIIVLDKNHCIFARIDIASESASKDILSAIKEGHIHHVVSSSCFHWIEDQPKALANLLKVINPRDSSINLILCYGTVDYMNYATEKALNNQELSPYLKKLKEFHELLLLPWRRAWMIEPDPIKAYKKMMIEVGYKEDGITIEKLDEFKYTFNHSSIIAIQASFPDVLAEIEKMGLKDQFFKQFIDDILEYNARHQGDKLMMPISMI